MPLFIVVSGMAAIVVAGMRASVCSHSSMYYYLSFVLAIRLCLIRNEATYSATEYKAEIFDSRYRYIHQTFIVFYIKSNHLRPIHSGNN